MKKFVVPSVLAFALIFATLASALSMFNLPTSPVGVTYGPWGGGANSIFDVTLSNVPAGFDITNGTYPGWCLQRGVSPATSSAVLYPSDDPAAMPGGASTLPWNKINYLLNHKAGTFADIQDGISVLLGQRDPLQVSSISAALAADAEANGGSFVPGTGQILAVLMYSDGFGPGDTYQETMLELVVPSKGGPGTGTPGYWKNHPDAWPVSSITIGEETYTKAQAIELLGMPDGDKSYTMFRGYVAAFLNVQIGNDSSCITNELKAAYDWLNVNEPGSGVKASSAAWKMGEPTYTTLDNYNNGMLCAPHRD